MTTVATDVEADKARLQELAPLLAASTASAKQLIAERTVLWRRLAAAGLTHPEIAGLSDTTAGNVKQALLKARRQSTPTRG